MSFVLHTDLIARRVAGIGHGCSFAARYNLYRDFRTYGNKAKLVARSTYGTSFGAIMIKEMIEENHMYDCNDCKQDVGLDYWYMLYRIVWNAVCPENGMLCVPCLTKRLKRPLKLEDFNMDLLCNHTTDSVIKRHGIKI